MQLLDLELPPVPVVPEQKRPAEAAEEDELPEVPSKPVQGQHLSHCCLRPISWLETQRGATFQNDDSKYVLVGSKPLRKKTQSLLGESLRQIDAGSGLICPC